MSDAIYPKASKASKVSKPAKAPKAAAVPAQPVDDYEEYESDYDEYDEYDPRGGAVMQDGEDWDYEEEHRVVASPGRAIALGIAGVALIAVFAAVIWMLSTSSGTTGPSLVEGAQGGVPVIQGFVPTSESEEPVKGSYAPDFQWLENGKLVSLASFRGSKPVFVNFWGTWCPPCRGEMPAMETFYQQHKNDIQIIGVSMAPRDDPTTVLNFVKQANYSWKFIHDGDYSVAQKYQIGNVPSSYFIDKNGIIQAVQIGAMNESQIENYYEQVSLVK